MKALTSLTRSRTLRTGILSLALTAVTMAVAAVASGPSAHAQAGEQLLGGPNLDGYCRAWGADIVLGRDGVWYCAYFDLNLYFDPDVTVACQWQYNNPRAYARNPRPADPQAWRCFVSGPGGATSPPSAASPPGATSRYLQVDLAANRAATISWQGTPAAEGEWVSVVKVGTADESHEDRWVYTNRSPRSYTTGALAPGEYEVRLYGDNRYSSIIDRLRFRVP